MSGTRYHGKWIFENRWKHELPANAARNQQVVIQEATNSHDATTTQQVSDNQTEDMNDATSSSPDFSNLSTDVWD